MSKPALTPVGVHEKTAELYALGDAALEAEALLIHSDIRSWISDNFTTTPEQEQCLEDLPPSYLAALGEQAARAVRHRWPIHYQPGVPQKGVRSSKWVRSKESDEAGTQPTGKSGVHTGILLIETGY